MAAKDADLASDYAPRTMFLVDELKAQYSATAIARAPTTKLGIVYLVESGPLAGGGVTYRMRGYDSDLSRYVYWQSSNVDASGVDYSGNSGALTDVVVQNVIGQV